LIVPDKDADGLTAGVTIYRTLEALGLPASLLDVHLVRKGHNIHDEEERAAMLAKEPKFVIVVDQGSRAGPPVIQDEDAEALIIDHHLSDDFPKGATVCPVYQSTGTKS
jgi:single-stranded DNA-specific DHH superfamily exonuclease